MKTFGAVIGFQNRLIACIVGDLRHREAADFNWVFAELSSCPDFRKSVDLLLERFRRNSDELIKPRYRAKDNSCNKKPGCGLKVRIYQPTQAGKTCH